MTLPSERLRDLDLVLPPTPAPQGAYRSVRLHGGLAYVAGQLSRGDEGVIAGPVEEADEGKIEAAARACLLRALSALEDAIGIDRVTEIIFLRGFVFAGSEFQGHTQVLDRVSRLLIAVFGEAGRHARSAVGASGLPSRGLLEIELIAAFDAGTCLNPIIGQ